MRVSNQMQLLLKQGGGDLITVFARLSYAIVTTQTLTEKVPNNASGTNTHKIIPWSMALSITRHR